MRRAMLAFSIVAGMCLLSIAPADACGDKTLRIGKGCRYQRTMHPVGVLIYLPASTPEATEFQSLAPELQKVLKRQNHKARTIRGADTLGEVLSSGQYEVVLTDLAEAETVQKQIDNSRSKPVIVPVASRETAAQVAAAHKQFKYIVKNPKSGDQYLEAIEEAMRSRMRILAKKV